MNWNVIAGIAAEIVLAAALALLVRHFFFVLVLVKGRSMRPTLENEELMFVLRYRKGRGVRRGDIVICRFQRVKHMLVKRVIGLPGEEIRIEEGVVYINAAALDEPYARISPHQKMDARMIGANEYFVLGDNRPSSRDSRSLGSVAAENILGRSVAVVLPLRRRRRLG